MAKVLLGPMVAQASGSVGGAVFSRNRYGTYLRRRSHPTVSQSGPALAAKSRLGAISRLWSGLDDGERAAWVTWAANNPVTDRLGAKQVLAGNAAYMLINGRLGVAGQTLLDVPPVGYAPAALGLANVFADIGDGDFSVEYSPTPGTADTAIWVRAAVTEGDSQSYVKSKLRFLGISSSPATSPLSTIVAPNEDPMTLRAAVEARFGTLGVGQLVTYYLSVFDTATGLLSTPVLSSGPVVDTATGTLQVTILPQGAIDAGAKWTIDEVVTERASGYIASIAEGAHVIKFKVTAGYTKPVDINVNIVTAHFIEEVGTYVVAP